MVLDEVSTTAKTDSIILIVGARIFNGNKFKEEKIYEVEKRVRQTMRLLSRLYIKFKESLGSASADSADMFHKNNLKHLRFAVEVLSTNESAMKNGLKIQIQNTIKNSGKILEAHYLMLGNEEKAETVCEFMKVFGLVQEEMFNGALYQLKQKRNKMTRTPANLPENDFLDQLKNYMKKVTKSENFIYEQPSDVYVTVRDAACARLVIYNGRRGGEPARLFTYQWTQALTGHWIRSEKRENYKKSIESIFHS